MSILQRKVAFLSVALGAASLVPAAARAELYRARDANGKVVITNRRSTAATPVSGGTLSVAAPPGSGLRVLSQPTTRSRAQAARRAPFVQHVADASARYQLSPRLIEAVITVESGFNPKARSSKGAQGLMQLMPQTARALEVDDPWDPRANIHGGARYLRQMLDLFGGDVTLALAAYNAGPNAVKSRGGVPLISETTDYVRKVKSLLYGGMVVFGTSSLHASRASDGRVRLTNLTPTQSSVRLLRDPRGTLLLTNR